MAEQNNINLNISTRKRFTIDNDLNKVVELDVHDLALINRLSESIKKMDELKDDWEKLEKMANSEVSDEVDDALLREVEDFSQQFNLIETRMREIVDYIFDCPGLCITVLGASSIFSPVNGKYKYEQIIDVFTGLYEDTIEKEAKKINTRKVEARTSKYIKNTKKK